MKKILLLIFLTPIICFSQTSFSCNLKEHCNWNELKEDWSLCDDSYGDNSLFVMNKDETMFTHTTTELKSTYYVKEKANTKEQGEGFFAYEVVSDIGNEYYYIFDLKNKEVKAVATKGDADDWYLIRWYVKAVF